MPRVDHRLLAPLAVAALLLTGCLPAADSGSASSGSSIEENAPQQTQAPAEPLNLTGQWTQTNSKSADAYQEATVAADRIEINWVNAAEDTTAVYWAGTYTPPTDDADSYSWESQADIVALKNALLGSQDPTKTFSYQGGVLSYELSAMGVTMTVEMQRQE